jgi:hypothetical protein
VRALNIIFLLAFVASGVLQYNDPDPWYWTAFYTLAAACCLAHHMKTLDWRIPATMTVIGLAWCFWLVPQFLGEVSLEQIFASFSMQTGDGENQMEDVEEAREAGGTLIVALWCWYLSRQYRDLSGGKQSAEPKPSQN